MIQTKAKILKNTLIKNNFFHCVISASEIARKAYPGQFINVKINDSLTPLLRRPFSVYNTQGERVEFIYEAVGEGTRLLSKRKKGEYLDLIGPLGNGFRINSSPDSENILVAGGIGVAPLFFLARKLAKKKRGILVFLGAKTKKEILCKEEFKRLGCKIEMATDDGSLGFKGKITELFKSQIKNINCKVSTLYACGPRPMLKEICLIAQKYNLLSQISLEEHMACGLGLCLGCVVKTRSGYKKVCSDGPVFEGQEIIWEG